MVKEFRLKTALEYVREGCIRECYSYINEYHVKIQDTESVNMLVTLCATCNLQKHKVPTEYLIKIINLCEFKDLKEDAVTLYIQSVYYILKHFIENKKIYGLLQIERILTPNFIQCLTDKQKNFYKACLQLFHNGLLEELKCDTENEESIFLLIKIIINMSHAVHENFLQTVDKFMRCLTSHKINLKWIKVYYMEVIALIQITSNLNTENLNQHILSVLFQICNHFYKEQKLELTHEIIDKTILVLDKKSNVEEYTLVKQILKEMINLFSSIESAPEVWFGHFPSNLKIVVDKYKSSIIVRDLCVLIANCLLQSSKSWSRIPEDIWCRKMNINVQFIFIEIIMNVAKILKLTKADYCCKYKFDLHLTINLLSIIGGMCQNNVKLYNDDKHKVVIQNFDLILKYLEILKKNNCDKFKLAWQLIGTILYNISLKLYRTNNVNCFHYIPLFVKRILQFESKNCSIIGNDILSSILEIYSSLYTQKKDYLTAKKISAFAIYLYPNNVTLLYQWSKAKSELKFKETILDVLIENESYYKMFDTNFNCNFDANTKILLLKAELNHYKKKWRSSSAIKPIYIALYKLCDCLTTAKEILHVEIDDNLKMKGNVDIFEKIIIDIENVLPKDSETMIILGCFYYFLYYLKTADLIEQNQEDMENTKLIKTEEIITPSQEVKDPNETCDVVSSYRNLGLDIHKKLFAYMASALKNIQEGLKSASISFIKEYNVFNFVERLAHTYNLHCYTNESLQAWILALQISKLGNDNTNTLHCIAFIIEKITLDKYSLGLIKEAEHIIKNCLMEENGSKDLEILIFYVNLCFSYLHNEKIDECMKLFEIATEYYFKFDGVADNQKVAIARIRYNFLHGYILNLPCKYGISHHEEFSLIKPVAAQQLAISYITKYSNIINEYVLSVSFEITENLLNLYCWTRQPREVRCYGKQKVILAQQILVPFRTCRLLVYLAKADILSCNYDDCQIKLDGLSDMLSLRKSKSTIKEDPHDDITAVTNGLNKMKIDFPSTAQPKFASAGSPVLYTESFKLPSFLSDNINCECIPCTNLEYQKLVFEKVHLDAILSYSNGNVQAAEDFFKASLFIYNQLKIRSKTNNNFEKCLYIYCSIILDYNKLKLLNNAELVIEYNTELLEVIETIKNKHLYLYNEILVQRLLIITKYDLYLKDNIVMPKNVQELDIVVDTNGSKTPENKITKIDFKKSVSPNFGTYERTIKPIPFNLGEISPTSNPTKTPNPKIVIFTPSTEAASSSKHIRKKLDFTPQAVFKTPKKPDLKSIRKNIEFAPKAASTFIGKSAPAINTKKLTDKIKKSAIKIPEVVITDTSKAASSKLPVRKNRTKESAVIKSEEVVKSRRVILKDNTNSNSKKSDKEDEASQDNSKGAIRRTRRRIK